MNLTDRLNQILPRVTSEAFLSSEGIGNEIACYIFDYPAQHELQVRDHVHRMLAHIQSHHSPLRVLHLNLFQVVLAYLKKRRLFEKVLKMHTTKGDAAVLHALKGPLAAERLRDFIAHEYTPTEHDLVILSGIGSVWPMLRVHGLLNSLHTVMGTTPLVMFYPGTFDGTTIRLFGRITSASSKPGSKSYYRAFILVPEGATV